MRTVLLNIGIVLVLLGFFGLAEMYPLPSTMQVTGTLAGLGLGTIALLACGLWQAGERRGPERAASLAGVALLAIGLPISAVSFYAVAPYFTGESCSVALLMLPFLVMGLGITVAGVVLSGILR